MQGDLYVVAAPSGAGKTSLVDALIKQDNQLVLSISHTTRTQRPGEQHGKNYNFVAEKEFQQLIEQNAFLEHARVYDHHYGTTKQWVLQQLKEGKDVILEIDWQGAKQIKTLYPAAITIFILPPSRTTLEERLKKRGQDSAEIIAKRLHAATEDIAHAVNFDYLIVNNDFDKAVADLQAIIHANRLRENRQQKIYKELLNSFTD